MNATTVLRPVAEAFASDPQARADSFAAHAKLQELALRHDLPVNGVYVRPGQPGATRFSRRVADRVPALPSIELMLWGVRELVAWCDVLELGTLTVKRREDDTTLSAGDDFEGFRWHVHCSYGVVLDYTDDVQWQRRPGGKLTREGRMTLAAARALPERDREARA